MRLLDRLVLVQDWHRRRVDHFGDPVADGGDRGRWRRRDLESKWLDISKSHYPPTLYSPLKSNSVGTRPFRQQSEEAGWNETNLVGFGNQPETNPCSYRHHGPNRPASGG